MSKKKQRQRREQVIGTHKLDDDVVDFCNRSSIGSMELTPDENAAIEAGTIDINDLIRQRMPTEGNA